MSNGFVSGFKEGAKNFSHIITNIANFALLAIVYFIGVGITSVAAKICSKRFLQVKLNKDVESYWHDLSLAKQEKDEYYRQF